jgi:hypothetical protein
MDYGFIQDPARPGEQADVSVQITNPVPADTLDAETRWQVSEVLARYGHIVDNQEWDHLPLVFTPDATLDVQYATVDGLPAIQEFLAPGDRWRSHHTLNTTTKYLHRGEVSAWSRFLIVEAAGTTISGDYVDELTPTTGGWRIRSRRVSLRNRPDHAPDGAEWRRESFATWTASPSA